MAGLLDKAHSALGEKDSPPAADISPEERLALMAQIEKAVARTSTPPDPAAESYAAPHSGLSFALILNATAVALIAVAAVALPLYFNRQTSALTGGQGTALTGEITLVSTMRREAENRIQGKDAEISRIQAQADQASRELEAMRAREAAQIRNKEQVLQAGLDSRVAEERSRLQKTGLSTGDIDTRLATLRAGLQQEQERQLAELRAKLEAESGVKRAELNTSLEQSRERLARAETEKAQLQAQLDAASQAASRAQGDQARLAARLDALAAQGQREQLVLDQITSSYAATASAMQGGKLEEARADLALLASYLDQPGVASLPAVKRRRSVDLFLIDALNQEIASRLSPATAAAPSPAPSAAPAPSPEQAATLERVSALAGAIAAGDALYSAGNYAAALDRYGTALALLKQDVPGAAGLAARIADAGLRQAQSGRVARADRAAGPAMEAADALARNGSFTEAVGAYASVIRTWPESSLVPRALRGIDASVASLLRKKNEEAAGAERARVARADDLIATITKGLASAAGAAQSTASSTEKELITLLDAKVKVKSVLGTDAVRKQYPGLADALDRYLQLYGEEKKAEGRVVALQDITTVLDYLLGQRAREALSPLWKRYGDASGRAAFQQLLDQLRKLYQ